MKNLAVKTILGFAELIILLGLFLFAPAWTFDFWQAWVYLFVFFGSAALITIYLWKNDPKLLERRVKAGPTAENDESQQVIQLFASFAFIGLMVVPSLDHRFSWSSVPISFALLGDVFVASGFLVIYFVFKENSFTAGTIEVAPDQTVISTGPYAIVRHPMYAGALIMLFATPLALGSWWGLLAFVCMVVVIVARMLREETFLMAHLTGYPEYCSHIRWHLIPYIW